MIGRLYRKLPEAIKSVLLTSEGWLVGGSIESLINDKAANDYDIIVPDRELFQTVTKQLTSLTGTGVSINSFGGLKITLENGLKIDIWCEELDHFLKNAKKFTYLFNFKKNILLKNE